MMYEVKRSGTDPYDTMCGDYPVHETEWWEKISTDELRKAHMEELGIESFLAISDKALYKDLFGEPWQATPQNFSEYVRQGIAAGWLREAV